MGKGIPFNPVNGIQGVANWDKLNCLMRWRRAKSTVRSAAAGTARKRILCVGHSKQRGYTGNGSLSNYSNSMAERLRTILAAADSTINWRTDVMASSNNIAVTDPAYASDPRIAIGSGWSALGLGAPPTLGGPMWFNKTGTGVLSFTPLRPFDTCDFYTLTASSIPSPSQMTLDVGGRGTATVNCYGTSNTVFKQTISSGVAAAVQAANATRVNGDTYVIAADTYIAAQNDITVWRCGWDSGTTVEMSANVNPWDPLAMLELLAPDLTIFEAGLADTEVTGPTIPLSTTRSNYIAMINAARISGDVIVINECPSNDSVIAPQQPAYRAMVNSLVQSCPDIVIADMWTRFGSWSNANGLGFMHDNIHENPVGYDDKAAFVAPLLLAT